MGVYTHTVVDHTSTVAPARLFKALSLDNHNLMPKVVPQSIKSIEFVEGDSTAVGCVKQINFPDGFPLKYVKNRVDELDVENLYIKYTAFEGSTIGDNLECVVYEGKFEPSGEGCHYTLTAHFHTPTAEIAEQNAKFSKEGFKTVHETIEQYLIAHPEVYA